eukprot:6746459-Prymnesium_polylepis.1
MARSLLCVQVLSLLPAYICLPTLPPPPAPAPPPLQPPQPLPPEQPLLRWPAAPPPVSSFPTPPAPPPPPLPHRQCFAYFDFEAPAPFVSTGNSDVLLQEASDDAGHCLRAFGEFAYELNQGTCSTKAGTVAHVPGFGSSLPIGYPEQCSTLARCQRECDQRVSCIAFELHYNNFGCNGGGGGGAGGGGGGGGGGSGGGGGGGGGDGGGGGESMRGCWLYEDDGNGTYSGVVSNGHPQQSCYTKVCNSSVIRNTSAYGGQAGAHMDGHTALRFQTGGASASGWTLAMWMRWGGNCPPGDYCESFIFDFNPQDPPPSNSYNTYDDGYDLNSHDSNPYDLHNSSSPSLLNGGMYAYLVRETDMNIDTDQSGSTLFVGAGYMDDVPACPLQPQTG